MLATLFAARAAVDLPSCPISDPTCIRTAFGRDGALAVTGVGAALLGLCYAQCYKLASATAVTIAGNCNKALSVFASKLLIPNTPSLDVAQLVGLLACLGGGTAYSLARAPAPPGEGKAV